MLDAAACTLRTDLVRKIAIRAILSYMSGSEQLYEYLDTMQIRTPPTPTLRGVLSNTADFAQNANIPALAGPAQQQPCSCAAGRLQLQHKVF